MEKLFKPSKFKIIINIVVSLFMLIMIFFINLPAASPSFSSWSLYRKIATFFIGWFISFAIYYPLTSGILYLVSSIKNARYDVKKIIIAILMIIIFNPISFTWMNYYKNYYQTLTQSTDCGLVINEILENSKVEEAGVRPLDLILKVDGEEVQTVNKFLKLLDKHKPGDKVVMITDKGERIVELVQDPESANHAVLGVMLAPNPCKK